MCPPIEKLDAGTGHAQSLQVSPLWPRSSLRLNSQLDSPVQSEHELFAVNILYVCQCFWLLAAADLGLLLLRNRHLALSSNNIDKIAGLSGLDSLLILSLGRNQLKKIENVEPVAGTLQQLWVSYNLLDKLVCAPDVPVWPIMCAMLAA